MSCEETSWRNNEGNSNIDLPSSFYEDNKVHFVYEEIYITVRGGIRRKHTNLI